MLSDLVMVEGEVVNEGGRFTRIDRDARPSRGRLPRYARRVGGCAVAASRDAGTSRWCIGVERVAFAQIEFATDSPLEGAGFEPSVPREDDGFETAFRAGGEAAKKIGRAHV